MYSTIPELLEYIGDRYSNKQAFYIRRFLRTTKLTYSEVGNTSFKIASYVLENGLKPGDKVLIWAPNMPEWSLALLGCLSAGVVVVPVGIHSTAEIVKKYIEKTDPKILFASKYYPIDIAGINKKEIKNIYLEDLIDLVRNTSPRKLPHVHEDELAEIVFTSGTTGDPKGVMISHKNILYEIQELVKTVPKYKNYRLLSVLPLSHVMEQIVGLFGPMTRGGTIFYLPRINAVTIRKGLKKYRITDLGIVPQMLRMFLDNIEYQLGDRKLRHVLFNFALKISQLFPFKIRRLIFSKIHNDIGGKLYLFGVGSAPLDVGLAKKWEAIGMKVVEGYGLSETTGAVTANSVEDRHLGSVGITIPGVKLRLSEENEIQVKSDNVTRGYFEDEEKTKNAFTDDGFFKTGDIGRFDGKYLYITGRDKFKIVTASGDKVYPEDVEKKINDHSDVWDSCVYGLDKGDGEIVAASLILKKGHTKKLDTIIQEVNFKLEFNQKILEYSLWPEKDFPRLHTLKVDRGQVKKYAETSLLGEEPKTTPVITFYKDPLNEIISKVCRIEPSKIHEDSNLVLDFDLDSLKRVELVSLIEDEFGVEVDESLIGTKTTVKDLKKIVGSNDNKVAKFVYPQWPLSKPIVFVREMARKFILFNIQRLFITKITTSGYDNLKEVRGRAIFIFNHTGHDDAAIIIKILPKRLRLKQFALGNSKDHKNIIYSAVIYLFGNAFPIDKFGGPVKNALEFAADLLEEGWNLVVAPEGKISRSGKLQPFKSGVAMLAIETATPVIPIKIEGYEKIFPETDAKYWFPKGRGEVKVIIGKPIFFKNKLSYIEATQIMEKSLSNL
jgi:long-chain acyl-CoA synthetase